MLNTLKQKSDVGTKTMNMTHQTIFYQQSFCLFFIEPIKIVKLIIIL